MYDWTEALNGCIRWMQWIDALDGRADELMGRWLVGW